MPDGAALTRVNLRRSRSNRSGFRPGFFNRAAALFPGGETALDMGNTFQTHILGRLRRQG